MSVDLEPTTVTAGATALSEAELTELTVARTAVEDEKQPGFGSWLWAAVWPKLVAIGVVLGIWEALVLFKWKPDYVLPSPGTVLTRFWEEVIGQPPGIRTTTLWDQLETTMQRGLLGYALAIAIGTLLGLGVVQWRFLRLGIGSLIAGLQTMPSIAWFPLAILIFGLHDSAIMFVVVLGAAPSIAAGVISGIDEVPPPLLRAGKMIGARGFNRYRYIVLPAAMPSYLMGLKQGWAFSWRSLLAGELLVPIGGASSLGGALMYSRTVPGGAPWLFALMIVILIIGMVIDAIFGIFTKRIRENRGLTGAI